MEEYGRLAVWYACEIGCPESVRLLLSQDNTSVVFSEWRPPWILDVVLKAENPSIEVIDEMTAGLVHRRNRLSNLADENIPYSGHDTMIQADQVLD